MKVALAQFISESNTFNPSEAELELFTQGGIWLTDEPAVRTWCAHADSQLAGSLEVLEAAGWTTHPVMVAMCGTPAGRLSPRCFRTIRETLRETLRATLPVDAILLHLHGAVCADFGCNVGGFTDCLLSRGASKIYAIDTGYGELAWTLRKDPRVAVMERTNALYVDPPELVNLVVIDMAWTVQHLAVPAATRWLKQNDPARPARIVALLKPHYELTKSGGSKPLNVLPQAQSDAVCAGVCEYGSIGKAP